MNTNMWRVNARPPKMNRMNIRNSHLKKGGIRVPRKITLTSLCIVYTHVLQ